jgi:hypothetical protein
MLIDLSHGMIFAQPLCKGHLVPKRVGSSEAGHLEKASATASGALRKEKIEPVCWASGSWPETAFWEITPVKSPSRQLDEERANRPIGPEARSGGQMSEAQARR